eukprot:1161585-Pelagomonas_calceolata.AAC.21
MELLEALHYFCAETGVDSHYNHKSHPIFFGSEAIRKKTTQARTLLESTIQQSSQTRPCSTWPDFPKNCELTVQKSISALAICLQSTTRRFSLSGCSNGSPSTTNS